MSSAKALKKKIAKRAKQKKNIQVKNSIRLKQKADDTTSPITDTTAADTATPDTATPESVSVQPAIQIAAAD